MKKILLIDDSFYERERHQFVLRSGHIDCEVLEAVNGREALDILKKQSSEIGLIILDWHMPVLDGADFLREFVKHPEWSQIKAIMSTSFGSDERKAYIRQIFPNLAGYVVKPYQPEVMLQAVKQIINAM